MALGGWRRLRIAVPLSLLVMILMRLVWMQLRAYPVVPEARAQMSLDVVHRAPGIGCGGVRPQGAQGIPAGNLLHNAIYDWIASPAFVLLGTVGCQGDRLEDRHLVKLNQWLLVGTVIMGMMMTRFITSSWTVSLIVAAMLFSRGRLLADIGDVSTDGPVMFLVTVWLACGAHYLRTGAAASLIGAVATVAIGALWERSLVALCLPMPAMLLIGFVYRRRLAGPVLKRLRGTRRRFRALYGGDLAPVSHGVWPIDDGESMFGRLSRSVRWMLGMEFAPVDREGRWRPTYQRGGLFRVINIPFLLWAYWGKRWLWLSLGWLAAAAAMVSLLVAVHAVIAGPEGWQALPPLKLQAVPFGVWADALTERFDLHLTISLIIIVICALQSPAAGLSSFVECIWLTLFGGVALTAAAALADAMDAGLIQRLASSGQGDPLLATLAPRPVVLWLEPVMLSLGVAGIYNLMKVLDTRIAERA